MSCWTIIPASKIHSSGRPGSHHKSWSIARSHLFDVLKCILDRFWSRQYINIKSQLHNIFKYHLILYITISHLNVYTSVWRLLILFHLTDFSQVATVGNKSWLLLFIYFFNSLWCQENNAAIYINIIYADM